jgi:hypothetical protein
MIHKRTLIPCFIFLLLFTTLPLSGCSNIQSFLPITPEDSAIRYVKEMKAGDFNIFIDSIETVQKVKLNKHLLVLLQYSGTRMGGGAETCELVVETDKAGFFSWVTHSGIGACQKINDSNDPRLVTVSSSRKGSTSQDPGYSTVYGIIRDPQITQIVVTWEDGQTQTVEAQESAYMAAREGELNIVKIEAYNGQKELVYTTEHE